MMSTPANLILMAEGLTAIIAAARCKRAYRKRRRARTRAWLAVLLAWLARR